MVDDLAQAATDTLLIDLGDLAAATHASLLAKDLGKLLQRLEHTVRRLIENHRPLLGLEILQHRLASLLLRQETLKAEAVAGQSTRHQGRNKGRGSRKGLDRNASGYGLAGQ